MKNTKKDILMKYYEMWLDRLIASQIDYETYMKLIRS
jgi:hypothetical protein